MFCSAVFYFLNFSGTNNVVKDMEFLESSSFPLMWLWPLGFILWDQREISSQLSLDPLLLATLTPRYAPYLYTAKASYSSSSPQTHISNHIHYWRFGAIPGTWQSYEAEALCFLSSFMKNQIKNQIVSKPRKPVDKDSEERKRLLLLNEH